VPRKIWRAKQRYIRAHSIRGHITFVATSHDWACIHASPLSDHA